MIAWGIFNLSKFCSSRIFWPAHHFDPYGVKWTVVYGQWSHVTDKLHHMNRHKSSVSDVFWLGCAGVIIQFIRWLNLNSNIAPDWTLNGQMSRTKKKKSNSIAYLLTCNILEEKKATAARSTNENSRWSGVTNWKMSEVNKNNECYWSYTIEFKLT